MNNNKESLLFIAYRDQYIKLLSDEILWISSEGNYTTIHTKDNLLTNRISLNSILKILPEGHFLKIHKSYIVRITAIDMVNKSKNEVTINEIVIPVGRTYKPDFLNSGYWIS